MLLALATAVFALAPGTTPAPGSAVVLMPFENLSGAPAAPAEVAAAVAKRIEGLGYSVVHGEVLEAYLAAERIRYLDSLASAARQKLLQKFDASGVVVGTIYSFAEGDNPIVGISARMLRADGGAAWAGVVGMSAEDTQGLLGLGRVPNLAPLADEAVSTLLRKFPRPGETVKLAGARGKPLGEPSTRTYRSAALPPGKTHVICILPFENRSRERVAPRVVGEILAQRMAASDELRPVEAADFRAAMVAAKLRGLGRGDPEELRKLSGALGTSLFLTGTIDRYGDASPRNASITPEIDLHLTLTDASRGRVVWTASLARKGTDYMGLLELGSISSVVTLADQVAAEVVSAFEHTEGRGRRPVTAAVVASDKTYDRGDAATITSCSLSGALAADAANLRCSAASATFADANAGAGKAVTATGLTLSGSAANRYILDEPTASTTATIRPKQVTAAVAASDKTYDGTALATITSCTLAGVFRADSAAVDCSAASASFADPNAGSGKTVTAGGIALSGGASGNYVPSSPTAATTATIRRKSVAADVTVSGRTYDGTPAATIAACSLPEVLAADAAGVACRAAGAAFDDANAGTGKPVAVTGISLSGPASDNYALVETTAAATADITPKPVEASIAALEKLYDGTTTAQIADCKIADVVEADSGKVGCEASGGAFSDKNAGAGKSVTAPVSLTGGGAGNYILTATLATTTASISPRPLASAGVIARDKTYDGTTAARLDIGRATLPDEVAGDDVALDESVAVATFADKDVGTDKTVAVSGLTLGGRDAGNYALDQPQPRAAITRRPAEPRIAAANRVYDGTTAAELTSETLSGVLPADGENVRLTVAAAAFETKNVGTGKTVTATGLSLSGDASRNYTLSASSARTKASIAPKHVTGSFTVADKPYDGSAWSTVRTRSLSGAIPGDAVRLSGGRARFADPNVGTDKTVTLEGARLIGADSGNYVLDSVAATTADITTPRKEPS